MGRFVTRLTSRTTRTQRPVSNSTYNGWDFRYPLNIWLAVGPAFLHR
jgi:hypothetical protein